MSILALAFLLAPAGIPASTPTCAAAHPSPRSVIWGLDVTTAELDTPEDADAAPRPDWKIRPRGGSLEEREGTRVLFLTGTLQERGFAEGYLLGNEIFDCFEEFALGHVAQGVPRVWDLVLRPLIHDRFEFSDEDRKWARAVVVGVGLKRAGQLRLPGLDRDFDARDVLACAAVPDIAGILCSSVAAFGDATTSGDVIVARNLDYPSTPAIRKHAIIEVHAPLGDRAGWVGVGWPGSLGCLTGLSDRGVFAAIHDVDDAPAVPGATFTPRVMALQELMEVLSPSTETANEAVELLRAHRFMMGGNVMLAWQAGEPAAESGVDSIGRPAAVTPRGAAVLEIGTQHDQDRGVTLRMPADGHSFLACSNHHRLRSKDDLQCRRYRGLMRGARRGSVTEAVAWDLIDESGMSITLYRCVANLGTRTMEVQRRKGDGWSLIESIVAGAGADSGAANAVRDRTR